MDSNYRNTRIFCCTNYGYMEYTLNFIEFYKRLNAVWKLHVYCMDKKSYEIIKLIKEVIAHDLPIPGFEDFYSWGQAEYKQICYYRYKIIYPLFKRNSVKYIIHFDTDIALLKDPVDFMIDFMKTHNCDIAGQCDEKSVICVNHQSCPNICGGCFILRNNDATLRLCTESSYINTIQQYHSDQAYFNTTLKHKMSFPTNLFIHPPKDVLLNENSYIYHFNWMIGDIKKEKMKEKNYWLLNNS